MTQGKQTLKFLISLIAALGLTWLVTEPSFSQAQTYVLFLLCFSVGLWLTEAVPPFAVGLFILAYLAFTLGSRTLHERTAGRAGSTSTHFRAR